MSFRLHPEQDALFLDIDGTLLDIAPLPDGVVVPKHLLDDLARLHGRLDGALALISGRPLAEIDTLFSPLRLPASGAHGAEWRIGMEKEARDSLPDTLRQRIGDTFATYPALLIEDKRYSMAVHYRQAPEMGEAIEKLLQKIVSEVEQPISIMPGKMVYEIVYPWHNKGAALECFMTHTPFAGRRPVFLGDDETDVFAINACLKLGGIAEHVGQKNSVFSSPGEVRDWIARQA